MNLCRTCGEDFGSVFAFDAHRVGKYLPTSSPEYVGPLEDWTPARGRRCLSVPELEERGFVRNRRERWSLATSLEVGTRLNASLGSRVSV